MMICTQCGGDKKIRCDDVECYICAMDYYCDNAKVCTHCVTPEPPCWEQRSELKITGKMREVVKMTISATNSEIAALRRKIERLTYGS